MSRKHIVWMLLPCLLISACVKEYEEKTVERPVVFETENMVPGVMRIKVSEELAARLEQQAGPDGTIMNTGVKSSDDILQGFGFKSMKRTFPYSGKFEARTRKEGLHLWYNVTFDPNASLTKAGTDLSKIEGVEIVEGRPKIKRPEYTLVPIDKNDMPKRKTAAGDIFDDPYLDNQWHYYNDGSLYGSIAGCDINVLPAWENGFTGSSDVIVAVLDGGIDYEHQDLKDNMWVNEAELNGAEGVDDDGNGYVDDIYGYDFVYGDKILPDDHGTHVAGTIAAINNNGIGVCGIAGGNKALGIPGAKVMSCQIFYGEEGAYDLGPAFKYAADNGAVISQNSWGYETSTLFQSDLEAIEYFIKYAGVDENGNQTGPMKGGIVIFAGGNEDNPFSSPGGYERVIGVSAVAADYERAYYSNYGSWCDIAAPGGDTYKGHYIISTITGNGYRGLQGTSMACPHVSGAAALITSIYGGAGFTPTELREMLLSTTDPIIYQGHNSGYDGQLGSGLLDVGAIIDKYGIVTTPPAPVTDFSVESTGTTSITLAWTVPADEDDGQPVTFNIYYSSEEFDSDINREDLPQGIRKVSVANDKAAGEKTGYTVSGLYDGTEYYFAIDAMDRSSASSLSSVIKGETQYNYPPEIISESTEITLPGIGYSTTVDLKEYVTDRNNDALVYTCSYPKQYTEVSVDGDIMTVKALQEATTEITVNATDPFGKEATIKFHISVMETGLEYFCYPNPVIDFMYIKSSAPDALPVTVSIESMSGLTVYSTDSYIPSEVSPEAIDLRSIKTGNYIVIITDSEGNKTKQNIMKL